MSWCGFSFLNKNVPIFFVEIIFKRFQEDVVQISWRFTVEMTSISSELESRGLTVNCEKTVAMVIHPRSSKTSVVTSIDITCGRTTIPLVDSTRMLGVIIDSNLS